VIDVAEENLIPLREAPRHIPPRPNGKRLHISAIYRWVQHGVRGVQLEAVSVGGTTYTSLEALQRFADRVTEARTGLRGPGVQSRSRSRQIKRASSRLNDLLSSKHP
jgi:hypothetical protein